MVYCFACNYRKPLHEKKELFVGDPFQDNYEPSYQVFLKDVELHAPMCKGHKNVSSMKEVEKIALNRMGEAYRLWFDKYAAQRVGDEPFKRAIRERFSSKNEARAYITANFGEAMMFHIKVNEIKRTGVDL